MGTLMHVLAGLATGGLWFVFLGVKALLKFIKG